MALEGKLVLLREELPEDLAFLAELRNDLETQAWNKTLPPDTTEQMYRNRYLRAEFSFEREDGRFILIDKETGETAGMIGYSGLQPRWSALIGIMVAKKFWGKGVAAEAQDLVLRFLFLEQGVQVVRLYTHSGNPRMVRLAEKAGFRISERRRQAVYKGGEILDNLMMDLLREEFFATHPELRDQLPRPFDLR